MGRRFTKFSVSDALSTKFKRGSRSLHCNRCPKFKNGYCSIWATHCAEGRPCCAYGKVLIRTKKTADRRKKEAVE